MSGLGVALAGGCLLAGAAFWRYRCRVKTIPWPHQLAFFLENPYMWAFCNKYKLARRLAALSAAKQATPHLEKTKEPKPIRVLDLGCGAGRILVPFAKLCGQDAQFVAMDMQPEMLAKARAACLRNGINNVLFRQLTLHPPYREPLGTFDLIYLVTVLGEIPRLADVLFLLYRSLSLGGTLSITETLPDPCYLQAKTVRQAGEAAGLTWLATRHGVMSYTIEFAKL